MEKRKKAHHFSAESWSLCKLHQTRILRSTQQFQILLKSLTLVTIFYGLTPTTWLTVMKPGEKNYGLLPRWELIRAISTKLVIES